MDEAESIYRQLGALLATMPDLRAVDDRYQVPRETLVWVGKVAALIRAQDNIVATTTFDSAVDNMVRLQGEAGSAAKVEMLAHRAFAIAEFAAPASASGAFLAAGHEYDAFAAVGRVLREATEAVLIVDPYMDEVVVSDFGPLVSEGVTLALLTDESTVRASLRPAVRRWSAQYGAARPLTVRLAPPRSLHDRLLLIDRTKAWILTQSLKDLAKRSPATLQQTDPELAKMKFAAYEEVWHRAQELTDRED